MAGTYVLAKFKECMIFRVTEYGSSSYENKLAVSSTYSTVPASACIQVQVEAVLNEKGYLGQKRVIYFLA